MFSSKILCSLILILKSKKLCAFVTSKPKYYSCSIYYSIYPIIAIKTEHNKSVNS